MDSASFVTFGLLHAHAALAWLALEGTLDAAVLGVRGGLLAGAGLWDDDDLGGGWDLGVGGSLLAGLEDARNDGVCG